MVALLRVHEVVDGRYRVDLSPETQALCEGYAAGLNYYAFLHPDEVLAHGMFPVSGKDVVAGSVHKSPLFFGLDKALGELFGPERAREVCQRLGEGASLPDPGAGRRGYAMTGDLPENPGSNTFSVSGLDRQERSPVVGLRAGRAGRARDLRHPLRQHGPGGHLRAALPHGQGPGPGRAARRREDEWLPVLQHRLRRQGR